MWLLYYLEGVHQKRKVANSLYDRGEIKLDLHLISYEDRLTSVYCIV